jgi:hypothetical protein
MKLSDKAQAALDKVVSRFQAGDLSPVVEIIRFRRPEETPSSKWTLSNQILAYIQTGSLDCRGYRQWQQVGRHVERGSKAAFILAPCLVTVEDEETGGTKDILRGFRGIPVFAYHDTDGDPLAEEIDYTPKELPPLVDVAERLGISISWQPTPADRLGDCKVDGSRINIGTHDTSVFFHELAHAAHAKVNGRLKGGQHAGQETIAEFTACVLMQLYGIEDRSGNAWQYIANYATDPIQAIVKALTTVEKVLEVLGV